MAAPDRSPATGVEPAPELGPTSLLWRYAGDTRIAFLGSTIGLLQLMHPAIGAGVLELAEITGPGRVDALRVGFEASVEVFDIGGVAAIEERRKQELFVLFLSGHVDRCGAFRPAILLTSRVSLVPGTTALSMTGLA